MDYIIYIETYGEGDYKIEQWERGKGVTRWIPAIAGFQTIMTMVMKWVNEMPGGSSCIVVDVDAKHVILRV